MVAYRRYDASNDECKAHVTVSKWGHMPILTQQLPVNNYVPSAVVFKMGLVIHKGADTDQDIMECLLVCLQHAQCPM